jgi:hypothetical protein
MSDLNKQKLAIVTLTAVGWMCATYMHMQMVHPGPLCMWFW